MADAISGCVRRARKPSHCFACREPIAVGAGVHVSTMRDDGRLYSIREHPACADAMDNLMWAWCSDSYDEGSLAEFASDEGIPIQRAARRAMMEGRPS